MKKVQIIQKRLFDFVAMCSVSVWWSFMRLVKFRIEWNYKGYAVAKFPLQNKILSDYNWTIWPVWVNGWVFVYEVSFCGFESSCSHLNFRFRACFEQGVPWHSGNYRVWIHSETRTWHDKNIQSNIYDGAFIAKIVSR